MCPGLWVGALERHSSKRGHLKQIRKRTSLSIGLLEGPAGTSRVYYLAPATSRRQVGVVIA